VTLVIPQPDGRPAVDLIDTPVLLIPSCGPKYTCTTCQCKLKPAVAPPQYVCSEAHWLLTALLILVFSKGWLRRKLRVLDGDFLVWLEYQKENRPFSRQQHQAQLGLNPTLATSSNKHTSVASYAIRTQTESNSHVVYRRLGGKQAV